MQHKKNGPMEAWALSPLARPHFHFIYSLGMGTCALGHAGDYRHAEVREQLEGVDTLLPLSGS